MFVISKFINGITLNPKEYALTENGGDVAKFETPHDALSFLKRNGVKVDSVEDLWDEYGFQIEEDTQCN